MGLTYTDLLNKTLELYFQEDYLKAYHFITENASKVKGNKAQIYNFRYSIACRAGLIELAMEIMKEAVVLRGYWYSYDYLMNDDDLKPLHGFKEFHELANLCRERETASKIDCKADLEIIVPNHLAYDEKYALVIALHGNQENIQITKEHWLSSITNRRILALPQSSQIEFSEAYAWNDVEKGTKELKDHFSKILNKYNIDTENIIIGGFSAGARISLNAVLNNVIKVKGFIFIGPWLPEIDEWEPLLDGLRLKGLRGYIICGNKDEDCFECSKKFVKMLGERNIPNVFKIVEGLDHNYPVNFAEELEEAVKFISGTNY